MYVLTKDHEPETDDMVIDTGGRVSDISVDAGGLLTQQHKVSFKYGDTKETFIAGTSAELFSMCKKILDTIYKDKPMQKAVARANLIEE